jgi:O-antigen ligase
MVIKEKNSLLKLIVISAFINTLIITPFFNKDGMIIPKLIVIFSTAMLLIPIISLNLKVILKNSSLKIAIILNSLILLQHIFAIFASSAPLEQQIYGRTGRGLGLLTVLSVAIVLVTSAFITNYNNIRLIIIGLIVSSFFSSFYSMLQSFGIDFIAWDTKTNGVIGTLGNPNFQSAFAAMALVPSLLYFSQAKSKRNLSFLLFIFFIVVIMRTQSTQGIIAGLASLLIMLLFFFWYRNKIIFVITSTVGLVISFFAIFGMLSYGPLSKYLYKVSVQSRGDFWRSAFTTANNHPVFGVGLDSFGDYSLKYRDQVAASHPWAEYTDNAHNFFLQQAATSGYPSAALYLLLVFFVLYSFFKFQIKTKKFEPNSLALFSAWLVFQMVSVISPENLVILFWNAVISGAIIGLAKDILPITEFPIKSPEKTIKVSVVRSAFIGLIGLIVTLPLFNTDRLQFEGMRTGNANKVMEATIRFPESTVRYNLIGRELYNSGLMQQALKIARAGVEFNPNSAAMWALVLVNPNATIEERVFAKNKILELDPLNKNVKEYTPQ